jgi:hypothetical protein
MKLPKLIITLAFAVAVLATPAFAAATDKDKHAACCEKAKAAGKECDHKCCVEAKAAGKECEKCNKPAEPKK